MPSIMILYYYTPSFTTFKISSKTIRVPFGSDFWVKFLSKTAVNRLRKSDVFAKIQFLRKNQKF